ncbi:MAG: kynU [Modestobacter sp.]|nr:kynU [Modestobacter sp.]
MDLSRAAAATLDDTDPLAGFRARFTGTEDDGPGGLLYLDDNSLGRLPRETPAAVARVVEQEWGRGLVGSWADWVERSRRIGDVLAAGVLAAGPGEVLVGDSTSVNLDKLLAWIRACWPLRWTSGSPSSSSPRGPTGPARSSTSPR